MYDKHQHIKLSFENMQIDDNELMMMNLCPLVQFRQ